MKNNTTYVKALHFLEQLEKGADAEEIKIANQIIEWAKHRFLFNYRKLDQYSRLDFGTIKGPPVWIKTKPVDISISWHNVTNLIGKKSWPELLRPLESFARINPIRPKIPLLNLKHEDSINVFFCSMQWLIEQIRGNADLSISQKILF